ncbi:hypothetical protein BGZ58_000541 [Dissophora ornata]|nr:hypothetical protein BGZ58_000541 [Dissophora ornata]
MVDLNIFYFVDGEPTSNAFSVKATSTETVDDPKVLIKARLGIDTLSKGLTLWCMSVRIADDDKTPIVLDSVDQKKKLGLAIRFSKVFPDEMPEETIHVIVQLPQPGRSASPPHEQLDAIIKNTTRQLVKDELL